MPLVHVFRGEVLILHCHENDGCQELDDWHSDRSRFESELRQSNQNAYAFRSNSSVAKMEMSRSKVGAMTKMMFASWHNFVHHRSS